MTDERRAFPRRPRPIAGLWSSALVGSGCLVVDLSWSGCFVRSIASPIPGERVLIRLELDTGAVLIDGVVRHRNGALGFGMQFDALHHSQAEALLPLLGHPAPDYLPRN